MAKIAKDRSMRTYDKNGHLLVEKTVITKAGVNPYFGEEIPDYEKLGLLPKKVYNLLRAPDELQKGLSTFRNIQLMLKHIEVDADDPKQEYTVGAIGTDLEFDGEYVTASLRVFDAKSIRLIESDKLSELSASYYYDADMTQGTHDGVQYDGVMRNIHGNHVALVYRGRIGRDAIIKDAMPENLWGVKKMALKRGAYGRISAQAKKVLAFDSELELTPAQVEALVELVEDEIVDKPAEDEEDEKGKKEEDKEENKDPKPAEDTGEDTKKNPAMDAEHIRATVMQEAKEAHEALELVRPLVGNLAFDSAENIYQKALSQLGIDVKGVHPSAYKTILGLQGKKPKLANDSAHDDGVDLPDNLKKFI